MTLRETYQAGGGIALHNIPVLITEYERTLAEKDKEIAYLNMRVDALRRFLCERVEKSEPYQQLMEQAIKFARTIENIANRHGHTVNEVGQFLSSPEAQAFLKEREHGSH